MCACFSKKEDGNMHETLSLTHMVPINGVILCLYIAQANKIGIMFVLHTYNIEIYKHTCIYVETQTWVPFLQKQRQKQARGVSVMPMVFMCLRILKIYIALNMKTFRVRLMIFFCYNTMKNFSFNHQSINTQSENTATSYVIVFGAK